MLKITVELLPGGAAELRRTLGCMRISNVSDLNEISDYDVLATEAANPLTGERPKICGFKVRGHVRRQSVWKLVAAALHKMEDAEKIDP